MNMQQQYDAAVATVRGLMTYANNILPVSIRVREHFAAFRYVFDVASRGKWYVVGVNGDKCVMLHRGCSIELVCN